MLKDFAHEFSLCISNVGVEESIADWTFESSMGVRRRIDYVLVSQCLSVHGSGPTDQLNLGSDHRAVQATIRDTKKGYYIYHGVTIRAKGWSPEVDMEGNARKYCEVLHPLLQEHSPSSLPHLQKSMSDAAMTPGIRIQANAKVKPGQSQGIQDLI